jgi:hypothetical protein
MPASAARAPGDDSPARERQMSTGKKDNQPPSKFRAVGMLYLKEEDGVMMLRILYASTTLAEVREKIADKFGIGALEWKNRK